MSEPLLTPSSLPRLTGEEAFEGVPATVLDFWRWALGDLRMNNVRGYVAEFLVARAVSSADAVRIEWGSHDVTAVDGTRIEVKSSAYLQSWGQRKLSSPSFSLSGATEIWDERSGTWGPPTNGRVDVWVFCLQTCTSHELYDPLAVDQWRFWTLSDRTITDLGQKTAVLSTIQRLASDGVGWSDLQAAVNTAANDQRQLQSSG